MIGKPGPPATLGDAEVLARDFNEREARFFGEFARPDRQQVDQDTDRFDVSQAGEGTHGEAPFDVVTAATEVAKACEHSVVTGLIAAVGKDVCGEGCDPRFGVEQAT